MPKKPETKFKEKIKPLLDALPNTWFVKIQQVAIRGIPDYVMCVNGNFVALELKPSEDIEPDELQKYNLQKIKHANGLAMVVFPENWDKVYDVLFKLATGKFKIKIVHKNDKGEMQ